VMPRQSYGYPKWLRGVFRRAPWLARAYRGFYFNLLEWRFRAFHKTDNLMKRTVRRVFEKQLNAQVQDPALRAKLTPDYPVGCKRILISDDYFPAIQRANVDLVTDGIAAVTPEGVRTVDGTLRPADVIILATGFRVFDILESMDVAGPGGTSMRDLWKEGISAHRTVAVPGFPNFFILLGPNSGLGHNSVVLMIEAQVNYVLDLIRHAEEHGGMIAPAKTAAKRYDDAVQTDLQDRVWASQCGAWYVDENGRNFTLYPHNVRSFLREMRRPDFAEYELSRTAVSADER